MHNPTTTAATQTQPQTQLCTPSHKTKDIHAHPFQIHNQTQTHNQSYPETITDKTALKHRIQHPLHSFPHPLRHFHCRPAEHWQVFWVLKTHGGRVLEEDLPAQTTPSLSPTAADCSAAGRGFQGGGDLSDALMPLHKFLVITVLLQV